MDFTDAFHEAVTGCQPTTVEQAAFLIWLVKREMGADTTTQWAEQELHKKGLPVPTSYFSMRIQIKSDADSNLKKVLLTGMVIFAHLHFTITAQQKDEYLFFMTLGFIEAEQDPDKRYPYIIDLYELDFYA